MMANSAMARVTMAKNMALTRRERKLTSRARADSDPQSNDETKDKIDVRRIPVLADEHGHAVGSDAEKHDMSKGENSRVTEQDVETGHQDGKNHDFQGEIERFKRWKHEREPAGKEPKGRS